MSPGWLPYVEAVILVPDLGESWLLHAYLTKHDGRWLRYSDETERRTKYTTPTLYAVKLWAEPAIREAKVRAWNERGNGEDYYEALGRIAHAITQRPEYPLCVELDEIWHRLAVAA